MVNSPQDSSVTSTRPRMIHRCILRSLISAGRREPLALRSALKEELDSLTSLGVIKPVDEPTNWVNNIIIAMKPLGDLQISIDLKNLKKPLKRERY